jgi:hypothetical protein
VAATPHSPSFSPLAGRASQSAMRPAASNWRSLSSTCAVLRKLSQMKPASLAPMRSLLLGMMAVCGIFRPSGWRNSATTANQSAMAPTMAASANAATYPRNAQAGCRACSTLAAAYSSAAPHSRPSATRFMRRSAPLSCGSANGGRSGEPLHEQLAARQLLQAHEFVGLVRLHDAAGAADHGADAGVLEEAGFGAEGHQRGAGSLARRWASG